MNNTEQSLIYNIFLTGHVFYNNEHFIMYDYTDDHNIHYKIYPEPYQTKWNKEISDRNITIHAFMQEYLTSKGLSLSINEKEIPNFLKDLYTQDELKIMQNYYNNSVTNILDGL